MGRGDIVFDNMLQMLVDFKDYYDGDDIDIYEIPELVNLVASCCKTIKLLDTPKMMVDDIEELEYIDWNDKAIRLIKDFLYLDCSA